jgi:hypothetical protein
MAPARTWTTADLPESFRPDPLDIAIREAARRAGLSAACSHGRADCDECLARAARALIASDAARGLATTR